MVYFLAVLVDAMFKGEEFPACTSYVNPCLAYTDRDDFFHYT